MKAWLRPVLAIARVAFSEIVRDKILYNVFVVMVLLMGVGYLASRLSYVSPWRFVTNMGFTGMGLCSLAVGILVGANAIPREFERRTAWVALSHPITRYQFVWGKMLGICCVLGVNTLIMELVFSVLLLLSGGEWSPIFIYGFWLVMLQAFLGAAIAILVSSFSTVSLAVTISIGLSLLGMNISQLRFLSDRAESEAGRLGLVIASYLIPNFENFQAGEIMAYQLPISPSLAAATTLYAFLVITMFTIIAAFFLKRREV
ncbi:MAG: ABC transporter permease [Bdellovibrionota bacterium]